MQVARGSRALLPHSAKGGLRLVPLKCGIVTIIRAARSDRPLSRSLSLLVLALSRRPHSSFGCHQSCRNGGVSVEFSFKKED
jgi:hypothetical protein